MRDCEIRSYVGGRARVGATRGLGLKPPREAGSNAGIWDSAAARHLILNVTMTSSALPPPAVSTKFCSNGRSIRSKTASVEDVMRFSPWR